MEPMRRTVEPELTVLDTLLLVQGPRDTADPSRSNTFAESVAHNLHMLLNTRREEYLVPSEFEQCATSTLNFGVPDLAQCGSLQSTAEQNRVCKWLEDAIRNFEPRLQNVSVRLMEVDQKASLRFRLEAKVDFLAERVTYVVGFRRDSGQVSVIPS